MQKVVWGLAMVMMLLAGCSGIEWFPEPDPNAPASVTVTADPTSSLIGSEVIITATVKKADGTAVPDGTTVSFTTTAGTLSAPSATTIDGEATVILTGPATPQSVTVRAFAGTESNPASDTVAVEFQSLVSVSADPTQLSVSVDGSSEITATVQNVDGTPNVGATVSFEASAPGAIFTSASATTDADGKATVTLTVAAGVLPSGTVITITATDEDSNSATTKVTMIP